MLKSSPKGSEDRPWKAMVAILAAVAVVAMGAIAVLLVRTDPASAPSAPATTAPATQPATSPRTAGPTSMPSSVRPTAASALAPFFASARVLDGQLRTAAAAINASGPPWTVARPDVSRKVRAADLAPVAGSVPAGLPHDLLQSVILVLSDLSSRSSAMASFQTTPPEPGADLLRELRNGHPAAARFERDLAAARSLAGETPAVIPAPNSSRQAAEVLLLVRYVQTANGGCASRGGVVVTRLPKIVWGPVARNPEADGTVGGVAFSAALQFDGRWQVDLFAC